MASATSTDIGVTGGGQAIRSLSVQFDKQARDLGNFALGSPSLIDTVKLPISSVSLADLGGKNDRVYIVFLLILSGFLV